MKINFQIIISNIGLFPVVRIFHICLSSNHPLLIHLLGFFSLDLDNNPNIKAIVCNIPKKSIIKGIIMLSFHDGSSDIVKINIKNPKKIKINADNGTPTLAAC